MFNCHVAFFSRILCALYLLHMLDILSCNVYGNSSLRSMHFEWLEWYKKVFFILNYSILLFSSRSDCTYFSPAATTVFLIFLLFEALLFGIFTAIMCGTQLTAICSDETGIESLKNERATWEKKSRWTSLKTTFGSNFSFIWFSPFHSSGVNNVKSEVTYSVWHFVFSTHLSCSQFCSLLELFNLQRLFVSDRWMAAYEQ